ncbi:MAG: InlB B-repeat-containing protein [Clostridia bacterium]|nr:InlB B-repeat-containing protein [Clostridia bacterium]
MRLKKILSIILVILTLSTTIFSSSCSYNVLTKEEVEALFETDGMFNYCMITEKLSQEKANENYYVLCDQKQEILPKIVYVPAYFNKKIISRISLDSSNLDLIKNYGNWRPVWKPTFYGVETLHIPCTISLYAEELFSEVKTIFLTANNIEDFSFRSFYSYENCQKIFLTRKAFDIFSETINGNVDERKITNEYQITNSRFILEYFINTQIVFQKANTTFYFNYEESLNEDIFFINDFERGEKIENTPYEPIREGYKFKGWYKEPECVNAWNFEEDRLPAPEYYENGELKYVETCLYAKWEK